MDITGHELVGYCGIRFLMGALRQRNVFLRDLWSDELEISAYKATMSREFEIITKFKRFGNKETHTERRQRDKQAAFRDIWQQFVKLFRQCFIVSDMICVVEQITCQNFYNISCQKNLKNMASKCGR